MKIREVPAEELSAERGLAAKDYIHPDPVQDGKIDRAKLLKMSRRVVELWESVEKRADEFHRKFKTSDATRAAYLEACKDAAGGGQGLAAGQEFYEACKAFLEEEDGASDELKEK